MGRCRRQHLASRGAGGAVRRWGGALVWLLGVYVSRNVNLPALPSARQPPTPAGAPTRPAARATFNRPGNSNLCWRRSNRARQRNGLRRLLRRPLPLQLRELRAVFFTIPRQNILSKRAPFASDQIAAMENIGSPSAPTDWLKMCKLWNQPANRFWTTLRWKVFANGAPNPARTIGSF